MAGSAPLQWRSWAAGSKDAQLELRAPSKDKEAGLEVRMTLADLLFRLPQSAGTRTRAFLEEAGIPKLLAEQKIG